ncbi:GNAT family N-acetyltransferase [Microbaculum marinum]|uniref:GNAT family N-acetyltransferase n=1 Tax=Microbaculum marinum TaxID=1764581 RepID=A0AAW9RSA0_9HYPH
MFVRTAGARDLVAIRELLVETWHATYDGIYGADRVTAITDEWHSQAALEARLHRPSTEFIVADDGATLAGVAFAGASADGGQVTLHQLYVCPDRQGQGIGTMLLAEILDSYPDAKSIRLEVELDNAAAVAFYVARGFRQTGRTEHCGAADSGIPALILERALV